MGNPQLGIYPKFVVTRTDGKSAPGEKHDGCRYFVLDLDHDEFAVAAIGAYAAACIKKYPKLAYELLDSIASIKTLNNPNPADAFATHMERNQNSMNKGGSSS